MSLGSQLEADVIEALERVAPAIAVDLWAFVKLILMVPAPAQAEALRRAKFAILADLEDTATDEALRAALHAAKVRGK